MLNPSRQFDLRAGAAVAAATLLGLIWAVFNLYRAGGSGAAGASSQLIWTVFAIPFFAFWGWLLVRPGEGWLAAFACFCIYFFSVFLGARLELLIQGTEVAAAHQHALYFRLTPALQVIACLSVAGWRSASRGTIETSTKR